MDLPTLLDGKPLGVDIGKWGPFTIIKVNGFVTVTAPDGIAKDGVLHGISNVLIPPKKLQPNAEPEGEISVEDLIERLEPYAEARADL